MVVEDIAEGGLKGDGRFDALEYGLLFDVEILSGLGVGYLAWKQKKKSEERSFGGGCCYYSLPRRLVKRRFIFADFNYNFEELCRLLSL